MSLDLKKPLKNCRQRIFGMLNFAPTNARTARVENPGSPARDDKSKASNDTPEDESVQSPKWDLFFSSLLDRTDVPELKRGPGVGGNGHHKSADDEDMTHLFAGSAAVQTLRAQLDKLPDIRPQRVDSLKRAIAEGRYQIYPQQIAAAMLADGALSLG